MILVTLFSLLPVNLTYAATNSTTVYRGVNYSAVYNKDYYLNNYSDLRARIGNNPQALLRHFVTYGMKEGRQASSNFNLAAYKSNYADLRAAFGNNNKSYYLHYMKHGIREGRQAVSSPSYNVSVPTYTPMQNPVDSSAIYNGIDYSAVYNKEYYLSQYGDLRAAFGNNSQALIKHFVNHGMSEGRQGSSEFNVHIYRSNYIDLQYAFGSNLKSYYYHYMQNGKNEGRLAIVRTGWYTYGSSKYYYENGYLSTGWKNINNRKYYFNSNGELKSKTGIDVSQWQGTINWEKVKNDGIEFAIIRIGYGENLVSKDDLKAVYNMNECERLGIPYGVYLYSYGVTQELIDSEVQHMLRMIAGRNPQMGVYIDMEDDDFYSISTGEVNTLCLSFLSQITEAGYKAGVYANKYWFTTILTDPQLDNYQKWVAEWQDTLSYKGKYMMWQYTSKATVNGITENVVDLDVYLMQ